MNKIRELRKNTGYTLKQLRLKLGLVQADVAKALNISVQSYCNYEKGQRQPSPDMLSALADFFGVSVDYLLDREQPEPQVAFYNGTEDLTKEEIDQVNDFIAFLKSKRGK